MGLNLGHSELAKAAVVKSSVADPEPDPQELYVLVILAPDPLLRGTDPEPSIIKQK